MSARAVLLDRDGVLVADEGLLTRRDQIAVRVEAPAALRVLVDARFALVVVSNQAVVARGLVTEAEVEELQWEVERAIAAAGGPPLDGFYFCPHHPEATLERYRTVCDCRKPEPGLLTRAAAGLDIDLERSFMVGDRPSDVAAGTRAGCRTVLVRTGRHEDPPIVSPRPAEAVVPDHVCDDLAQAAAWILAQP